MRDQEGQKLWGLGRRCTCECCRVPESRQQELATVNALSIVASSWNGLYKKLAREAWICAWTIDPRACRRGFQGRWSIPLIVTIVERISGGTSQHVRHIDHHPVDPNVAVWRYQRLGSKRTELWKREWPGAQTRALVSGVPHPRIGKKRHRAVVYRRRPGWWWREEVVWGAWTPAEVLDKDVVCRQDEVDCVGVRRKRGCRWRCCQRFYHQSFDVGRLEPLSQRVCDTPLAGQQGWRRRDDCIILCRSIVVACRHLPPAAHRGVQHLLWRLLEGIKEVDDGGLLSGTKIAIPDDVDVQTGRSSSQ